MHAYLHESTGMEDVEANEKNVACSMNRRKADESLFL
jgi:hypothetical protein